MVALFVGELEAGILIDVAGGGENVVGPQGQRLVALGASEADALLNQPLADAEAARRAFFARRQPG